jgi:hypothetical protein
VSAGGDTNVARPWVRIGAYAICGDARVEIPRLTRVPLVDMASVVLEGDRAREAPA